jgi:hypothetical protein
MIGWAGAVALTDQPTASLTREIASLFNDPDRLD